MKATKFEYRHETLFHFLLVGLAVLTYLIDPDDIVWALVRHHSNSALLERIAFGAGALVMISSAALETWAAAYPQIDAPSSPPAIASERLYCSAWLPLRFARLLLALALGLLLPRFGTVILIAGEAILVFRLVLRDREDGTPPNQSGYPAGQWLPSVPALSGNGVHAAWGRGFRSAVSKWGVAASMILFTLTLKDRIVEFGCAISFFAWLSLNVRLPIRSHN